MNRREMGIGKGSPVTAITLLNQAAFFYICCFLIENMVAYIWICMHMNQTISTPHITTGCLIKQKEVGVLAYKLIAISSFFFSFLKQNKF